MNIKETIGIDISKLTIDVRIHRSQMSKTFDNTTKGFKSLMKWVSKYCSYSPENLLFAFEHTGLYSHQLSVFLTEQNIPFAMIAGLEIKRSIGITRGKDDKIDAGKIALYAYRLRDEITLCKLPGKAITKLKRLLSLRERLVKQRAGYKGALKEIKRVLVKKDNPLLFETQEKLIGVLSKQIDKLEQELQTTIKNSNNLSEIYNLATSVKGIGPQTALFLIAYTEGFTKFKTARKFASYCGIAPFPNSSGTSIRGRTKVSNLANKKIKCLLDLCAKSAIQSNFEMKNYYHNRINQGKNKMSTINIIRNKLLARVFAVVERSSPYIDTMKYAA